MPELFGLIEAISNTYALVAAEVCADVAGTMLPNHMVAMIRDVLRRLGMRMGYSS
jgi:hypothetical protein